MLNNSNNSTSTSKTSTPNSLIWTPVTLPPEILSASDILSVHNLTSPLLPEYNPILTLTQAHKSEPSFYIMQNFIAQTQSNIIAPSLKAAKTQAISNLLTTMTILERKYHTIGTILAETLIDACM